MPYHWLPSEPTQTARLTLRPNRSLSRKGFAQTILLTAGMLALPLLALLGTPAMWGLLPFVVSAVALLWMFLQRNYADGALQEDLTLEPGRIELTRRAPRKAAQTWSANPYWVRVDLHRASGPVENYLTLKGEGRTVEIGAFLSPDEREALFDDLQDALRATRSPGHSEC